MNQPQHYAYIHCKPDGTPFYVGKGHGKRAWKFGQRRKHHHNIVAKYGAENILVGKMDCSTEALAFELEKGLIKCLRRMNVPLCNMTDGGEGASGRVHRPESIELMRRVQSGKVISQEAREKMAIAKRGKKLSPSHVAKIVAKLHTPEARQKAASANTGKKRPIEVVAKIKASRLANGGYAHTEETKERMSEIAKRRFELKKEKQNGAA